MPEGARSLDAVVDVHVHLADAEGLEILRSAGVAAVRDAGNRANAASADGGPGRAVTTPVVVRSCWALYKRGGYGARFGVAADTKDDITSELLKLKKADADIIKVMASGMVSLERAGTVTSGGFDSDELAYIVREAARLGLGVMAHANGERALAASAQAGVRSIEHGFFMTEQALALMAEKRIFWTPTIGALSRAAKRAGKGDFVRGVIDEQLRMLARAHALGVPLAIGTDSVLPDPAYRDAYSEELDWFTQAGISRAEVMKIARDGGARLLGII